MELPITEVLADGRKADAQEFYMEILGALRGLDERVNDLEVSARTGLERLDALEVSARTTTELQARLSAAEEALSRFLPRGGNPAVVEPGTSQSRTVPLATFDVDQSGPASEIPSQPT